MWNPLEMGDGRPQLKVCCRAGDETGGWMVLEESREK